MFTPNNFSPESSFAEINKVKEMYLLKKDKLSDFCKKFCEFQQINKLNILEKVSEFK